MCAKSSVTSVEVDECPPANLVHAAAEVLEESQRRFQCADGDEGPNREPSITGKAPGQFPHQQKDNHVTADEQETLKGRDGETLRVTRLAERPMRAAGGIDAARAGGIDAAPTGCTDGQGSEPPPAGPAPAGSGTGRFGALRPTRTRRRRAPTPLWMKRKCPPLPETRGELRASGTGMVWAGLRASQEGEVSGARGGKSVHS